MKRPYEVIKKTYTLPVKAQSIQGQLRDQIYWALPVGERDYHNASQIAYYYIKKVGWRTTTKRRILWHVPRAIELWVNDKRGRRWALPMRRYFTPAVLEEMKKVKLYTGPDGE